MNVASSGASSLPGVAEPTSTIADRRSSRAEMPGVVAGVARRSIDGAETDSLPPMRAWTLRSARAISLALVKRSAGSLDMAFASTASSSSGTSGRSVRMRGVSWKMILASIPTRLSPRNGAQPTSTE